MTKYTFLNAIVIEQDQPAREAILYLIKKYTFA